jgi:hypothetical protein
VNTLADSYDVSPGDGIAGDLYNLTSLRAAIEEANALPGSDIINFSPYLGGNTITLDAAWGELEISSDISIFGAVNAVGGGIAGPVPPPPASITVTRPANVSNFRIFDVTQDGVCVIDNLNVTGGDPGAGQDGGGFRNSGQLRLVDCEVESNAAQRGGGIYNDVTLSGPHLELVGTTVRYNVARTSGGGLYVDTGTVTGESALFTLNKANQDGGGIYNSGGNVLLYQTGLYSNQAIAGSGGGIYNLQYFDLEQGVVNANVAGQEGGGLYNGLAANAVFQNSSLTYNQAQKGGGVYLWGGSGTFTSCDILNNTATVFAGLCYKKDQATYSVNGPGGSCQSIDQDP